METELLGVGDREADSDLQYRVLSSECVGDLLPRA